MESLVRYKDEVTLQMNDILAYWIRVVLDDKSAGFHGRVDHTDQVYPDAPRGAVLNARILWTFSAAWPFTKNAAHRKMADTAFCYFRDHFIDKQFGGVFWSVACSGEPLDTKKQIYAVAFAIYGLSEYYKISRDESALQLAVGLYNNVVAYSHDSVYGGYIEGFNRQWQERVDLRLSSKDANEKKSMNTHLHVLEAFSSLYRIWPDKRLHNDVTELLGLFNDHIIDPATHHLRLFFDESWNLRSNTVSFGHDIEAAWLLQDAAEGIVSAERLEGIKAQSVKIAAAAARGLDEDGGLWHEYHPAEGGLVKEKHWWPQAEAMIGFLNAWELSGERRYLEQSLRSWQFVKEHIIDRETGEWYWGLKKNGDVMTNEDKVGIWKCPYHNVRACIEVVRRIGKRM